MALHFCNKYNILVVRCVYLLLSYYPEAQWTHVDIIVCRLNSKFDLRRLCRSVGATILPKFVSLHNSFFLFPHHWLPRFSATDLKISPRLKSREQRKLNLPSYIRMKIVFGQVPHLRRVLLQSLAACSPVTFNSRYYFYMKLVSFRGCQ